MKYLINIRIFFSSLRSSLIKYINEIGSTNIFLIFLLTAITLLPLFFVRFTTNDDVMIAINQWSGHTWQFAKWMSSEQGRIAFLWNLPLFSVSSLFDSQIWYSVVKLGSFILLLGALYHTVCKLFKSHFISIMSLTLFITLVQNGWEHNLLTSYPFVYNLYAVFFLLSLSSFYSSIDRNNLKLAILSGVLYFFALGSELFVLFFPFYLIIILFKTSSNESIMGRLKLYKNYIFAIAIPLLIYILMYVIWRYIHPSVYSGNILNAFNPLAALRVVATYSLNAFPLVSMHFLMFPNDQLMFADSIGLHAILSNLTVAALIKPLAAAFLFARLMIAESFVLPRTRTLFIGSILSFAGIFLPNLLLGFTSKYQGWVEGGSHSYVYTYYSLISLVIFLALFFAYLKSKSRSWHPNLRLIFISTSIAAIIILSFAVEVRNEYVAFDQKLANRKWQLMEEVVESPAFSEIPDGSTIVSPTLLSFRGIVAIFAKDWSNYIKYKTGKNIQITDEKCKDETPCYMIVFRQQAHLDDQFLVLAKVRQSAFGVSRDLTIYYMPTRTETVIMGSFVPGKIAPKLEINGEPVSNVGTGLFSGEFPLTHDSGDIQVAKLTGNVDILPERIIISHYDTEPRLRSLSAELSDGIDFKRENYPDFLDKVTGMLGYEPWGRWTDSVAKFTFKQALPKRFVLEIEATAIGSNLNAPVKVRLGSIEKTFIITKTGTYYISFETNGDADTLEIIPPYLISPHEIDPNNSDTRKIGIGLIAIKIKG